MSDYIKKEDALFVAYQQPFYSVVSQIKQLEGIDIVRCKECKKYNTDGYRKGCGFCMYHHSVMEDSDFCSIGEREGE